MSSKYGVITVSRDVPAIMIPDGTQMTLKKESKVSVMQSLGGTYTLGTEQGFMVRIQTRDADAIGKEPEAIDIQPEGNSPEQMEKAVWDVMRTVYDPEIPVNIVDLGLVYECRLTPSTEEPGSFSVNVQMTLTAPGCGMGPVLQSDVEMRIRELNHVKGVNIEIVLDPPWDRDMMSEAAKLELGMF